MNAVKPKPFGHYFILEKIAQGGMAEIFKGLTYDFLGIKKFIVIKRILPHIAANKAFIDMLIAEAKIAVNLSHGNIAQTFDLGKVGEDYFIVMEYVDGKTLSQIQKKCQEKGVLLPVELCAYFISEICNGLDYIHRKKDEAGNDLKIVHRDISPQNMIVTESGNLKIVDFGVAQAAFKTAATDSGILKGKFAYMSPEQADGIEVDHRSDLFSVGIVMWELLTGQRLFKKKINSETVAAVKEMVALPPSQFRPDVEGELDKIVLKALEKNPDKRYISAQEMSLDLTRYLLKYHPDFKSLSATQFFNHIFDRSQDLTVDIGSEKTVREEATLIESAFSDSSLSQKWGEETELVNPVEIDFHSIFNEISWEDEEDQKKIKNGVSNDLSLIESRRQGLSQRIPDEELSVTAVLPFVDEQKEKRMSWIKPLLFLLSLGIGLALLIYWLR